MSVTLAYISTLSLDIHIALMHKSIQYHFSIAVTIASSYILPLFDYCNNLLFNLPAYKLIKLQRLQNSLVRCVHLLPRRSADSIIPLLKQLHWLPVSYRIKHKLSLTIYKADFGLWQYITTPLTTLPPFSIYTHPLIQYTPDPPIPFSLLIPSKSTPNEIMLGIFFT